MGAEEDAVGLAGGLLGLVLLHQLPEGLRFCHCGFRLLPQLAGLGLQGGGGLEEQLLVAVHQFQGSPAGGSFDAAHTGSH